MPGRLPDIVAVCASSNPVRPLQYVPAMTVVVDGERPDPDLGLALAHMLGQPQEWVSRRVDRLSVVGYARTRREVSVDFTLPAHPGLVGPGGSRLVPLALVAKQVIVDFDLRDDTGRALPLLGTEDNGRAAWSLLCQTALAVVDALPDGLRPRPAPRGH